MTKRRYSLKLRLVIAATSLVIWLVVLELCLQAAGWFLSRETSDAADGSRIFCFGDSYTFGGLVDRAETYPAYLQHELDRRADEGRYQVVNYGVCEANTGEIYEHMQDVLTGQRPDLVLLLAGSANRFNPWDFDRFVSQKAAAETKSAFMDLRVVQLVRLMWTAIQADAVRTAKHAPDEPTRNSNVQRMGQSRSDDYRRQLQAGVKPENADGPLASDHPLARAWAHYAKGDVDAARKLVTPLSPGEGDEDLYRLMLLTHLAFERAEFSQAEALLAQMAARFPTQHVTHGAQAFFMRETGDYYRHAGKNATALRYYLRAIAADPREHYNYYWMSKLYDLQSVVTAQQIAQTLEAVDGLDLSDSARHMLGGYVRLFHDRQAWEAGLKMWIRNDLDRMIALCDRLEIPVVLLTYPLPYELANMQLKTAADAHGLPLVNLTALFAAQPEKHNLYFFDDDHCKPEGHRAMMEEILKTLLNEKVVQL